MTHAPLTADTALALAIIVTAARSGARVARAVDDGDIIYGTARSIGDYYGAFAAGSDDIRDCYLRVTIDTGWEAFWPMSEIVDAVQAGLFLVNPVRGAAA